jgi:hypothetical protein
LNTVVQLLADSGADLEAKNSRGQTALAAVLARRQGSVVSYSSAPEASASTADLLRKLGAKQ